MSLLVLAQSSSDDGATGAVIFVVAASIAFWVVVVVATWKVFTKAGEAGWKSLIPIWNTIVTLRIVGRPWWWILLFLIPLVNVVIALLVLLDLSRSFGHGVGFALGLVFLSPIFLVVLGFGDSRYVGPAALGPAATPPSPA